MVAERKFTFLGQRLQRLEEVSSIEEFLFLVREEERGTSFLHSHSERSSSYYLHYPFLILLPFLLINLSFHLTEMTDLTSPKSLVSLSTFLPWDPSDPINLSSSKSRVSPQSTLRALISLTQSQSDKLTSLQNNVSGNKYAFHEGMKMKTIKPPPIAQGPNPDEKVWMRGKELENWSDDKEIKRNFKENGGKSFVGEDYLELSPSEGPWSTISSTSSLKDSNDDRSNGKGSSGSDRERNREGKLIKSLDSLELDSLPIELLMKNDLSNERGLKWRMKSYNEKLERKKKSQEKREAQDEISLKLLREKVLEKDQ